MPYSYGLIDRKKNTYFFCDQKKITVSLKKKLNKVNFVDKNILRKTLSNISGKKFIIDRNTCSYYYENIILKKNKIINVQDPIYFLKAIKSSKRKSQI